MEDAIRDEFAAIPFFRYPPYFTSDGDPFCGWINAFFLVANTACAEFAAISDIQPDDIVYFTAVQPSYLFGMAQWMASIPPARQPTLLMDLIFPPGLNKQIEDGREVWTTRDPREDPRAVLYRFVGSLLRPLRLPRLHLVTSNLESLTHYKELLLRDVKPLPTLPFAAHETPFKRTRNGPLTLGVLGYQTPVKGYHFMPEVFAHLLNTRRDIRILAHNSSSEFMPEAQRALREMASNDSRLTLNEQALDADEYQALLDACDIIICPYDPRFYVGALSGLVAECLSNGIPLIVPAGTVLAAKVAEYGHVGTTFDDFAPASILDAAQRVLNNFEVHAEMAFAGAQKWAAQEGPGKYVDALMHVAQQPAAF
ncbi:MAG: hypothetical protein K2P94_04980 [Rhodospirillaceae bacterium]|nr:hypothetical protein [Rhodospirillaceae bacterium]